MKLIVAKVAPLNGIGYGNELLIKSKKDLKLFREYTLGNNIVMGYNTFKSIGSKPLPLRTNYVVTSRDIKSDHSDLVFISSLDEAPDDAIVIGGGRLYNAALKDKRLKEICETKFNYIFNSKYKELELMSLNSDTYFDLKKELPSNATLHRKSLEVYEDLEWSSPQVKRIDGTLQFEVSKYEVVHAD